jgi:hypothetical protein
VAFEEVTSFGCNNINKYAIQVNGAGGFMTSLSGSGLTYPSAACAGAHPCLSIDIDDTMSFYAEIEIQAQTAFGSTSNAGV